MTGAAANNSPGTLAENIASLSTLQLFNYAVPLITVPYLVRALGPAQFGMLSFAQALISYFDVITDYGFSLSATRAVAASRHDFASLARVFWGTLFAKLALLAASGATLLAAVAITPRLQDAPWLFEAAFLTVVGNAICPTWFFQGIERMKALTVAQAFARLLTVPALILMVRRPDDVVRAAAIQGCVPLVAAALLAPLVWNRIPKSPEWSQIAQVPSLLKTGWHTFVAHTALAMNPATTTVVLGLAASRIEVGYYSAADKVIRAVSSALGPAAQALYPRLNRLRAHSLSSAFRLMRRSFGWILSLSAAASVATFLLSRPVGALLWGGGFDPAISALRYMSPLPFLLALINVIGAQTMLVLGMDSVLSRNAALWAAVNIPLTAGLSSRAGARGAAAASVVAAAATVVSLAWGLRRQQASLWRAPSEPVCRA